MKVISDFSPINGKTILVEEYAQKHIIPWTQRNLKAGDSFSQESRVVPKLTRVRPKTLSTTPPINTSIQSEKINSCLTDLTNQISSQKSFVVSPHTISKPINKPTATHTIINPIGQPKSQIPAASSVMESLGSSSKSVPSDSASQVQLHEFAQLIPQKNSIWADILTIATLIGIFGGGYFLIKEIALSSKHRHQE